MLNILYVNIFCELEEIMPYQHFFTNRQINIPYLVKIGYGKIGRIGKYLIDKGMSNVALFWSDGLEELIGGKLYKGFEQHDIEIVCNKIVQYINIEEVDKVAFNLPRNTDAIIGIGGGKVIDFAKYCAHLLKKPFISVPTSISNDGFCSPNTSLLVDGRRTSVKSSIPFGVIIDLDIVSKSPKMFLYSGMGDMISKLTALWDWKVAFRKGYERYNDFSAMLAYNSIDILLSMPQYNLESSEFLRNLSTSLLLSGVSMEIAGTSRPASGAEHLIAHALDNICKRPHLHGIQVGVSTYLCGLLQNNPAIDKIRNFLLTSGFFEYVASDPLPKEQYIQALQQAPMVKKDYYTVLSEKDSFLKAVHLVETETILKKVIR